MFPLPGSSVSQSPRYTFKMKYTFALYHIIHYTCIEIQIPKVKQTRYLSILTDMSGWLLTGSETHQVTRYEASDCWCYMETLQHTGHVQCWWSPVKCDLDPPSDQHSSVGTERGLALSQWREDGWVGDVLLMGSRTLYLRLETGRGHHHSHLLLPGGSTRLHSNLKIAEQLRAIANYY